MKIIEIDKKNSAAYDSFVTAHPLGSIHQLWQWGEFQVTSQKRDLFKVFAVVGPDDRILASALMIRQCLPFGKCWFYCPRGPLADYSDPDALDLLFKKIAELASEQNAVFFRFDPPLEAGYSPKIAATLEHLKTRPAHAHYQPESTLILDLKHEPDELLKRMKPKGRYNIKVAQKHGVTVRVSDAAVGQSGKPAGHADGREADIEAFYALLRETTARDSFTGHPLSYYKKMLEVFGQPLRSGQSQRSTFEVGSTSKVDSSPRPSAKLYLAEHGGKVLAGMIATYFRDTATYYFGASSNENRHTMAPYLLHWQAIRDARAAGYHYYDFFGIAPENRPGSTPGTGRPHPWQKVTEFKLKFGGERVNYYPAQEIVYRPFWYTLIRLAKAARALLKR